MTVGEDGGKAGWWFEAYRKTRSDSAASLCSQEPPGVGRQEGQIRVPAREPLGRAPRSGLTVQKRSSLR